MCSSGCKSSIILTNAPWTPASRWSEDRESDLYAAIDRVTRKIEQQIRKRRGKRKTKKHKVAARSKSRRQESDI
jgi:ribosome-associated translation inhibitor RaiA